MALHNILQRFPAQDRDPPLPLVDTRQSLSRSGSHSSISGWLVRFAEKEAQHSFTWILFSLIVPFAVLILKEMYSLTTKVDVSVQIQLALGFVISFWCNKSYFYQHWLTEIASFDEVGEETVNLQVKLVQILSKKLK